jgi:hypothetical protein
MPFGATPSRWCVCQFHHFRFVFSNLKGQKWHCVRFWYDPVQRNHSLHCLARRFNGRMSLISLSPSDQRVNGQTECLEGVVQSLRGSLSGQLASVARTVRYSGSIRFWFMSFITSFFEMRTDLVVKRTHGICLLRIQFPSVFGGTESKRATSSTRRSSRPSSSNAVSSGLVGICRTPS